MATGRLGTLQLTTANTNQTVYTVPTGYYSVFNVSFTNTGSSSVTIKLAMASTATPATNEYIEQQTTIVGYGVFERTGLVANAGIQVVAQASANTQVNVNVYGIETSTS
jgi:hypothetical protein